jgi:hypothetical protein
VDADTEATEGKYMTEQRPFSPEYPKLRQDGDEWVVYVEMPVIRAGLDLVDVKELRVKDENLAREIFGMLQLTFGLGMQVAQKHMRHSMGIFP